jgi:ribosomal-protein-serine acetyltransferase
MKFSYKIESDIELVLWNYSMQEDLFNLIDQNRTDFYKFLRFIENIKPPEQATGLIKEALNGYSDGSSLNLAIFYKSQLVGSVVLESIDAKKHYSAEISYWIDIKFQGKGIVTKCVKNILDYAFYELSLQRVSLQIAESNTKSKKIAKNLHFIKEGVLREAYYTNSEFQDIYIYSKLQKEYKK